MLESGGEPQQEAHKDVTPPKDRGDILRRLRGLDGEPLQPPLTERILGNPAINTVVVFSGEAGGGKSTVLGQLDKEFAVSSVRTYHVFTEDAIRESEINLGRPRSSWTREDYHFMSENLHRMIIREKKRMQDEGVSGRRAILLVEAMGLPGADVVDRGQSTILHLESEQANETFYVGLPANPAIQDHANDVRDGIREVESGAVFDYLRSKNIILSGVEAETEELGTAIKEAILRQATRSRLELVRSAITERAREWASDPAMRERVAVVRVPEGSSGEYQIKAAYIEYVLRQIYSVPLERGVVALSPFDPRQQVEWNVAPFLKTEEENNEYLYPPTQKEEVLLAASRVLTDPDAARPLLAKEALAIARGLTTPDFLEILPGPHLAACLKIMRETLQADPTAFLDPPFSMDGNLYETQKQSKFQVFLHKARSIIEGPQEQAEEFLSPQNRKALGMATTGSNLIELAEVIEQAQTHGLLPTESDLQLINMSGTFDPFPHTGHVALANETARQAAEEGKKPRIVVTTFATNPQKKESKDTFAQRLDNLHRGFFHEDNVTVLGIPGDFSDIERRRHQYDLVTNFDKDSVSKRTCGSDVFQSQFGRALAGDAFSQFLLQASHPLYIVPRYGYDEALLTQQVEQARSEYGAEIVILTPQRDPISGTAIRTLEMPHERNAFAGSEHVRLEI